MWENVNNGQINTFESLSLEHGQYFFLVDNKAF